jgi:hypothetical protein
LFNFIRRDFLEDLFELVNFDGSSDGNSKQIIETLMECIECEKEICICENDEVRREILTTILELMNEKVNTYRTVMQNRVLMIKEDIVTTITEETVKFQDMINSNLSKLDTIMSSISEDDTEITISPDMVEAMTFSIDIDLDSENIQIAFNKAISGEHVVFRDMIKKKRQQKLDN